MTQADIVCIFTTRCFSILFTSNATPTFRVFLVQQVSCFWEVIFSSFNLVSLKPRMSIGRSSFSLSLCSSSLIVRMLQVEILGVSLFVCFRLILVALPPPESMRLTGGSVQNSEPLTQLVYLCFRERHFMKGRVVEIWIQPMPSGLESFRSNTTNITTAVLLVKIQSMYCSGILFLAPYGGTDDRCCPSSGVCLFTAAILAMSRFFPWTCTTCMTCVIFFSKWAFPEFSHYVIKKPPLFGRGLLLCIFAANLYTFHSLSATCVPAGIVQLSPSWVYTSYWHKVGIR